MDGDLQILIPSVQVAPPPVGQFSAGANTYMETDFPGTPTRKIVKRSLVEGVADLRAGAFDRVDGNWR